MTFDLTLALAGTPFQRRVWQELASDPLRLRHLLRRAGPAGRQAECQPGGGQRQRPEPGLDHRPLPPRDRRRRRPGRLWRRPRPQALAARARGRGPGAPSRVADQSGSTGRSRPGWPWCDVERLGFAWPTGIVSRGATRRRLSPPCTAAQRRQIVAWVRQPQGSPMRASALPAPSPEPGRQGELGESPPMSPLAGLEGSSLRPCSPGPGADALQATTCRSFGAGFIGSEGQVEPPSPSEGWHVLNPKECRAGSSSAVFGDAIGSPT